MPCTSTTCTARQRPARHISDLQCISGDWTHPGDPAAPQGFALHVKERPCTSGACLIRQGLAELFRDVPCTSTTWRARQRSARHFSNLHFTSGPYPAPQGPTQHPREFTSGNTLARQALTLPAKNVQSNLGTCHALPRLARHVSDLCGTSATCTAGRRFARYPRDPPSTQGTCNASQGTRLYVRRLPYPFWTWRAL